MVTAEEVAGIGIFAYLEGGELERLARAAADINLAPGEFAAQEGSERALFGVLEGRIEAVKTIDGIEKVVGERLPGNVFGEVPITLGSLFPVGFRAAEASRVLRLEPSDYHAVSAAAPNVGKAVGMLAAHRIGGPAGLQGLAAEPPAPRAIVVGSRLEVDSAALRRFLDRNQISYLWLAPGDPGAEDDWGGPLPARDDQPAISVIGGKTVVRPPLRRVAELLGLTTEAGARRVRRRRGRRRPRGSRRRGLRGLRGALHARRRARGARRPGRYLVAHRELPRLPPGPLGR